MSIALRNILFTVVVPGAGAVYGPLWILSRGGALPVPVAWLAILPIGLGVALYIECVWLFARVGGGTPGPWDAPRRFVAVGPYRWVRNPIYIAALFVAGGEAWLFLSLPLLAYTAAAAACFHGFVVWYEEPRLRHQFGDEYEAYRRTVSRWLPRPP